MNSNTAKELISENEVINIISKVLSDLKTKDEVKRFLNELLSQSEILALSKRWRILNLLMDGMPQREIAKNLNVSLCKITRGAKILNNEDSICKKILVKENKNVKRINKRK